MAENCSSAVCMSSAISCANTSGSGKSSDSTSTTVTSVRSRTNRGPLLVQFRDVLRLKLTTQADRGLSALRSRFDLHFPVTLNPSIRGIMQCMSYANADFTELTCFLDAKDC